MGKYSDATLRKLMVRCRIEQSAVIISAHKERRDPQVEIVI